MFYSKSFFCNNGKFEDENRLKDYQQISMGRGGEGVKASDDEGGMSRHFLFYAFSLVDFISVLKNRILQ